MTPQYFISVIIPVYNQKEILAGNFSLWEEQSYPQDKYEIIIVDDGSGDGLAEFVCEKAARSAIPIKYLSQRHQGPSAARNLGVREAQGVVVAFTDADCRVTVNWIEEISTGYSHNRVAGIGGTSKALPTKSLVSQYCAHVRMNEAPGRIGGAIAYIITANASFRKDLLVAAGGFDERYRWAGGEDVDVCYRLGRNGYVFRHNRKAVIYNSHKRNFMELLRTFFCYGRGDACLNLRKSPGSGLMAVKGLKRVYVIFAVFLRCLYLFLKTSMGFFKFPFRCVLYHGEGMNWGRAGVYACLELFQNLAFQYGRIAGYVLGQCHGFKG